MARDLHKQYIDSVVTEALRRARLDLNDLDAIAVTVRPGLSLSLLVGMNYAKELCRKSSKPLIPIHHMEAHALTARLVNQVNLPTTFIGLFDISLIFFYVIQNLQLPFITLLVSGGHCLLAVVKKINEFILLGQTKDDAPGETLDKVDSCSLYP